MQHHTAIQKWHVFVMVDACYPPTSPARNHLLCLLGCNSSTVVCRCCCCCCTSRWRPCQRSFCVCLEYITHFWLFTTTTRRNNKLCDYVLPHPVPFYPSPLSVCPSLSLCCGLCHMQNLCVWSSKIPDRTIVIMLLFMEARPNNSSLKLHLVSGVRNSLSSVHCPQSGVQRFVYQPAYKITLLLPVCC